MNRRLIRPLFGAVALVATLFLLIWIDDAVYHLAGSSTLFWRITISIAILSILVRRRALNAGYIVLAIAVCLIGPTRLITETWPVSIPLLAISMYTRLQPRVLRPAAIGLEISLVLILIFDRWGASNTTVWMLEKWARAVSEFAPTFAIAGALAAGLLLLRDQTYRAVSALILIAALIAPGANRIRRQSTEALRAREARFLNAWTRQQKSTIEASIATQAKTAWEVDSPDERQSIDQFALQIQHLGPARDRIFKSITDWQTLEGDWSGPPARLRADLALKTSGINIHPGSLEEAHREARAINAQEKSAQESEQHADEAWSKAARVFRNDQSTEFLRDLAKSWAERAFWAGVKLRLDRTRWTPALWGPGLYDAATGTSPLVTQLNREAERERE